MEKLYGEVELKISREDSEIQFFHIPTKSTLERIRFENSHDFCKFFLELARDMGINRFDFAAGCNAVADEIEGWDNL